MIAEQSNETKEKDEPEKVENSLKDLEIEDKYFFDAVSGEL